MVTHRCVVEDCPNSASKTRLKNKDIKYYPFPKDEEMRQSWLVATLPLNQPEEYNPDHNSFVCSEHFGANDFQRDLKAELLNLKPKRLLKPEGILRSSFDSNLFHSSLQIEFLFLQLFLQKTSVNRTHTALWILICQIPIANRRTKYVRSPPEQRPIRSANF